MHHLVFLFTWGKCMILRGFDSIEHNMEEDTIQLSAHII